MAKIQITFDSEMTKEKVKQIFKDHFGSKYEIIDKPALFGIDFAIKKSSFTGMAFKYIHKPNNEQAFIKFNTYVPSIAARVFLSGLLLYVILLLTSWSKMNKEVKEFIGSSAELKAIL